MSARLTIREAHPEGPGGDWFVDVEVRGRPGADVRVAQLEADVWLAPRLTDGIATLRARLAPIPGVPYVLLTCAVDGVLTDVVALGARAVALADVLRADRPLAPGTVVHALAGTYRIDRDLHLDRAHIVVGAGVTLAFARGAGLACAGGTVRILGSADRPVVLRGERGPWRNLTIRDALLGSRIVHATFQGGGGRPIGGVDVGGGLAVSYVGGLALEHVTFADCTAELGGGLYVAGTDLRAEVVGLQDNRAVRGGGAAFRDVGGAIVGLRAERNVADREGGALYCGACPDLVVERAHFADNDAPDGPTIWAPASRLWVHVAGHERAALDQPLGGVVHVDGIVGP